ncbi:hypothetical protein EV361DRAFT_1019835 [Lentinula raphanica]|nr:hypothetical protein EV361DRAFT_1019835 [Lentinula raphanica]
MCSMTMKSNRIGAKQSYAAPLLDTLTDAKGKPLLSKDSPKQPIILPLPTRMKKLKQETHIANDSVSSPPEAVHNDADFRSSSIKDFDEPASTRAHTEDSPPPRDEVDSNSNVHLTNEAGLLAGQAGSSVVHGLTLNGSVEGAPQANGKDTLDSSKSELQAIFQSADTESPLEVILKERLDLRTDGKEMFVDVLTRPPPNQHPPEDPHDVHIQDPSLRRFVKAKGTASLTLELSRPLSTQTTAPPTDTEILALDEFIDNNITEVLNSFERVGMSNAKGLENVQGGVIDRVTGIKAEAADLGGGMDESSGDPAPATDTGPSQITDIFERWSRRRSEERRGVNGLAIGGAGEFEWVVEGDGLDDRCIIQSSLLALKRASGSPITFLIRSMGSNADMIVIMTGLVPQKILNSRGSSLQLKELKELISMGMGFEIKTGLIRRLTPSTSPSCFCQSSSRYTQCRRQLDKDQTIQGSHIPPTHILPLPVLLPVLPIPLHPLLPHQLHLPSSSPPDVTAFTSSTLILPVATKIKSKSKKMRKKTLWRKKIMDSIETAMQSTSAIETKTTELSHLLRPHQVHHVDHVQPIQPVLHVEPIKHLHLTQEHLAQVASDNPASVQAEDVASGSSGGEAEGEDTDAGSSRSLSGKTTSMATSSLWSTSVTPATVVSTSAVCTSTSIDAVPDLPIPHPPSRPGYIPQQRGLVDYVTRTPDAPRSTPIINFKKIIYTIVDCQFFLSLIIAERVLPASQVAEYLTPGRRPLVGNIPSDLLTDATSPLPSPSPPHSAASQGSSSSPSSLTSLQSPSHKESLFNGVNHRRTIQHAINTHDCPLSQSSSFQHATPPPPS